MEALTLSLNLFSATATSTSTSTIIKSSYPSSSSSYSSSSAYFSPRPRFLRFPLASKGRDADGESDSDEMISIVPISDHHRLSLSPLSKDTAMGLVLSAATDKGWTTDSGMEGPSEPAGDAESSATKVSTFPWSLFTKSPRRRMLIAFTCNICNQRTTRAINPHAYTDGTVFVQCCGCNAYHKLVDHLNLFDGMKCYLNSSFKLGGNGADVNFNFRDIDDDGDGGMFGV